MAGRYARSMALLQQREMVLTFNLDKSALTVGPAGAAERAALAAEAAATSLAPEPVPVESTNGVVVRADADIITRSLDQVTMESVTVGDGDVSDGSCRIVYRSNGLCTPYKVTIADMYGSAVTIEVDALGSAVTADR
jgi:hypothetical protein